MASAASANKRALRHFCAGRNPPTPTTTPTPIHPSPLPGGRLGGGWRQRASASRPPTPDPSRRHPCTSLQHPDRPPIIPRLTHYPCPLPSSFLRRQEPSACDGCAHHRRRPAARLRNGWWAVGMVGWVAWGRAGSCLRRNDGGRGVRMTERAPEVCGSVDALWRSGEGEALDRWWTLGASHPPPNLPPGRREGRIGEGVSSGRGGTPAASADVAGR